MNSRPSTTSGMELLLRLLQPIGRLLVGSRRFRSGIMAIAVAAMMVVTIATLHNDSVLRTQDEKMTRVTSGRGGSGDGSGPLLWPSTQEEDHKWREPFDLFDSKELRMLKPLLDNYLNAIRRLRYSLLSANRTWTLVDPAWKLLNGYDQEYFRRVRMYPQISTVFLTADFDEAMRLLPVHEFYDYAGTDCTLLTDKERAIYANGDELLNKSCRSDLRETLTPMPLDRTMLSLGLPFQLSPQATAPTGHVAGKVILTFINIVQNGVVTSHGEVLSGNMGIMTQRCSLTGYKPVLPADAEQLPLYDEVLTITQQTLVWYYHGTIEDLPRVAPYLELLRDNPHIKVHITRAEFHQQMLAYLGVGADRLVSGPVRGRIVYLPAGTTCGRPPVFNTQVLAAVFRQRVATNNNKNMAVASSATAVPVSAMLQLKDNALSSSSNDAAAVIHIAHGALHNATSAPTVAPYGGAIVKKDTVILIRRSSPDRQFRHHDAIVDMLRWEAAQRGLRVRVFADDPLPPLATYIRLFQAARLVVAPHGAGLANLLFAPPGTAVVEGLCEMEPRVWFCLYGVLPWLCHSRYSRVSLSFRNLAAVLGQHYAGVSIPEGCLHARPAHLRELVNFYLDRLR